VGGAELEWWSGTFLITATTAATLATSIPAARTRAPKR
jgi:hypothetical protein